MGSTPIEDAMRIDAEANARSTNRKVCKQLMIVRLRDVEREKDVRRKANK
jgi:hypothetical protein